MIKNIIFDLGSVIIKNNYDEMQQKFNYTEKDKQFIIDNIFNSPEFGKYGLINTGFLTIENVIDLINDRTNHINDDLVKQFILNYRDYKVWNGNILNIIKRIKNNGYKLYLLTNTSEYVFENFKTELELLFDGIVASYEIHAIKPYDEIYKYLITTYKINPKETLFIDDNQKNIDTANKLGIIGRKVEPSNYTSIIDILHKEKIGM